MDIRLNLTCFNLAQYIYLRCKGILTGKTRKITKSFQIRGRLKFFCAIAVFVKSLSNKLTVFMTQTPFREVRNYSTNEEIHHLLWNSQVHFRVHRVRHWSNLFFRFFLILYYHLHLGLLSDCVCFKPDLSMDLNILDRFPRNFVLTLCHRKPPGLCSLRFLDFSAT